MGKTRCLMCGILILPDAKSYEKHIEERHSMDGYSVKIKPIRTTDRTHTQIVQDMEKGSLAAFIIAPDELLTLQIKNATSKPILYCGPTGDVCLWEDNGFEICGPCARQRNALQVTNS